MVKRRNYNIDFFRGFAVLWIILIHTCFWSGQSYVPVWLQSFSLIVDVPLFVFISGMTRNFGDSVYKGIRGLLKFYKQYLIFLILYFGILFFIDRGNCNLYAIVNSLFFKLSVSNKLPVVGGSFWFIYMFFISSFISMIIIRIYNSCFKSLKEFKYILLFIFLIYGMKYYYPSFIFIDVEKLFYIFIYLLGYYMYNCKTNLKTTIIFEVVVLVLLYGFTRFNDYGFLDMQGAKFAYHINYMLYSMISIGIVMYLKDIINIGSNSILCFVGKNALFFYFCQGIGASVIYYFLEYISYYPLIIKLLLMYLVNFVITSILVIVLIYLSKLIEFFVNKIDFNKYNIGYCLMEMKKDE